MPNRILREGMLSSPKMDLLSPEAEVFFTRLLLHADDYGRAEAVPSLLRAGCFPTRIDRITDRDVIGWVDELCKAELAYFYRSGGKTVLQILKTGNPRAKTSKLPDPPKDSPRLRTYADTCTQTHADVPYSYSYSSSLSSSEKPTPEPPGVGSDHKRVVDAFDQAFRQAHEGAKPSWSGKQGNQVKILLSRHAPDEILRRLEIYFDPGRCPGWISRGGLDLGSFVANFDKLATAVKRNTGPPTAADATLRRLLDEVREPDQPKLSGGTT